MSKAYAERIHDSSIVAEVQPEDTSAVVRARVRRVADSYTLLLAAKAGMTTAEVDPDVSLEDVKAELQSQITPIGDAGSASDGKESAQETSNATEAGWEF
jgi:hypothetical protein